MSLESSPASNLKAQNVTTPNILLFKQVISFPAMLGALLVAIVFISLRNFDVDPDLWWHLTVGESILRTHQWPTKDPYSFTVAGQPWLAYEWLGDVLLASVARLGGLRALQALFIILGASILLALYGFATMRAKNSKAGFLAAIVLVFLAAFNFNLRPQMLGYLFLILTLIILERFRQGKARSLWLLPPLFLLWINCHGSWEIGLATILLYWLCGLHEFRLGDVETTAWSDKERTQLSLTFLLSLISILITPYGPRLAAYPFNVASVYPLSMANIQEWQPISLNSFGAKLFLALVLGTIALQIVLELKWRLHDLLPFVGAAALSFVHARLLLIFVPFFAPVLAGVLARWVPGYERQKDRYILNMLIMASIVIAMIHYFPTHLQIEKNVAKRFPVDAVKYLRAHPSLGPVFNAYGFGGYLVYSLGNERKVFIDGRSELYEDGGVFADYLYIIDIRPGLLSVLRNYGIETCLVGPQDPLAVFLAAVPGWTRVYADPVGVIYVRETGSDGISASRVDRSKNDSTIRWPSTADRGGSLPQ